MLASQSQEILRQARNDETFNLLFDSSMRGWRDEKYEPVSHVVQIIRDAFFIVPEIAGEFKVLMSKILKIAAFTSI